MLLLAILSLWALPLVHGLIYRRADPPLKTLTVPLTLTADRQYTVAVNMSKGANPQRFHFLVTTCTGYSLVPGKSCESCNSVEEYDQSLSSSAISLDRSQNISIDGRTTGGNIIKEDCSLRTTGAPWVYPNQSIIVANQSDSMFSAGTSGIFGLGTNGRQNDFNSSVIAGWLTRNPSRSIFSYGMALNEPENGVTDGGVLHWIQPDPSFRDENIVWKDMAPMDSSTLEYDYQVMMDSWSFVSSNASSSRHGDLVTVLDPISPGVIFPQAEAFSIYSNILGSTPAGTRAASNVWSIPCDTNIRVAFQFGNITIVLDEKSLIRRENNLCFGTIEEWQSPNTTEYLLGSTFIAKLYLTWVISGPSSGSIGFSERSAPASNSGISTGGIVGATLGSVAFAISVGIVAFLFYRHRKNQRGGVSNLEKSQSNFTPYTLGSPNAATALLGDPPTATTPQSPYYPRSPVLSDTGATTRVASDSATADPDSPPPYMITHSEAGEGSASSATAQGSDSRPLVTLSAPPEDRKRKKKILMSA